MSHGIYIQIHSIHLFVQSWHLSGMYATVHQSLMEAVNYLRLQVHISVIWSHFVGFWRQMKAHLRGWGWILMILAVIQQEKGAQLVAQQVAQFLLLLLPFAFVCGGVWTLWEIATSTTRKPDIILCKEQFANWIVCLQNLEYHHGNLILQIYRKSTGKAHKTVCTK